MFIKITPFKLAMAYPLSCFFFKSTKRTIYLYVSLRTSQCKSAGSSMNAYWSSKRSSCISCSFSATMCFFTLKEIAMIEHRRMSFIIYKYWFLYWGLMEMNILSGYWNEAPTSENLHFKMDKTYLKSIFVRSESAVTNNLKQEFMILASCFRIS